MLGFSPNKRSLSVGSPLSPPVVVGYEWVRVDVLKYHFSIISTMSVASMEHQLKLSNLEDSYKMLVQACKNDDFSFIRAVMGVPLFLMCRCLFEVMSLILPLDSFQ